MNGPTAGSAPTAQIAVLPEEARTTAKATIPLNLKTHEVADMATPDAESPVSKTVIVRRMPTAEPYPLHENLDPMRFKPDKLDRDQDGRYSDSTSDMAEPATVWKEYTTKTDTFAKVAPPDQGEGEGEG